MKAKGTILTREERDVLILAAILPNGQHLKTTELGREGLEYGYLLEEDEQIIRTERRQDTILTKSEQDVLGLVGRGLTNKEIANTLFMSLGTVGTLIYRICTKLGACNRSEAFLLALKRGEIGIDDIYSLNELLQYLAPLGAESIEKIAQLLSQKLEQEPTLTGSKYDYMFFTIV